MRLSESFISAPLIIVGWIFSIIALGLLYKLIGKLDNKKLTKMATLGAFILLVTSIPIPSPIPGIVLNLSGVMISLLIFGQKEGILVASGAMILNHLIIPGSLGALGLNLMNMLLVSSAFGYIPHKFLNTKLAGRRLNYIVAFLSGLGYMMLEGIIILIELAITTSTEENLQIGIIAAFGYFLLLGLLEGFFTAITYSYYFRTKKSSYASVLRGEMSKKTSTSIDDDLYLEIEDQEDD